MSSIFILESRNPSLDHVYERHKWQINSKSHMALCINRNDLWQNMRVQLQPNCNLNTQLFRLVYIIYICTLFGFFSLLSLSIYWQCQMQSKREARYETRSSRSFISLFLSKTKHLCLSRCFFRLLSELLFALSATMPIYQLRLRVRVWLSENTSKI